MNKLYYLGLTAFMGFALMSCEDYKEPNPPAQSNSKPTVLQPEEVAVETELGQSVYDLAALLTSEENIILANIACDKLPAGYDFVADLEMALEGSDKYSSVATTTVMKETGDWQVEISPSTLSTAYRDLVPYDNEEAAIQLRYRVGTSSNGQIAMIAPAQSYFGPYTVKIVPIPLEMDLPDYLYAPGAPEWNPSIAMMLGTSDYETYSGFVYLVDEFKFTGQEPDWDPYNWGAGEEEGSLELGSQVNLAVDMEGMYWVTANLTDLTYTTKYLNTFAVIGNFNNWSAEGQIYMTSVDDLVWTATYEADGEGFKIRMYDDATDPDSWWDINLGAAGEEEPVELTPDVAYTTLVAGGKNFSLPEGVYTLTLDISKMPYTLTATPQ